MDLDPAAQLLKRALVVGACLALGLGVLIGAVTMALVTHDRPALPAPSPTVH